MTVLDLDTFELDLLCDACDSYIEDVAEKNAMYPAGTAERAEMVREKLRNAVKSGNLSRNGCTNDV